LADFTSYLESHRRTKSHEIQPPPLLLLDKIRRYAITATIPSEIDSTRDHLRFHRDKAFILTLCDTGSKISDLCALRVKNLDDIRFDILSKHPASPPPLRTYLNQRKSLDVQQILPIPDLPVFSRHDKRAGTKILPISRWTAATIVNYWVDQSLDANDQETLTVMDYTITSQSFRDAFVLRCLHKTGDLLFTMKAASHNDETTTRRYLPVLDQVAADIERLS